MYVTLSHTTQMIHQLLVVRYVHPPSVTVISLSICLLPSRLEQSITDGGTTTGEKKVERTYSVQYVPAHNDVEYVP